MIPSSWTGFRATRRFRGTTYDIEVGRRAVGDSMAGSGDTAQALLPAIEVIVDGQPIEGTCIPLPERGTARVRVEVRLT